MASSRIREMPPPARPLPDDIPILYEDEEKIDMGEANLHTCTIEILHTGLRAHLPRFQPELQVFANMNLYYKDKPLHKRTKSRPYVSPDLMVVHPPTRLPETLISYTVGREGPAPRQTTEVLSKWTAQDRDLKEKMTVYAMLGVEEYIIVDPSGEFLRERLLLKRRQPDGSWKDERDTDGGVTSALGFRIILDTDGKVRVLDARTGQPYPRPDEAWTEAQARRQAEERVRQLEADLQRLQQQRSPGQ